MWNLFFKKYGCAFLVFLVFTSNAVFAHEYILISGGPALRLFESPKESSHDKYWGNFVDAAVARMSQVKRDLKQGDSISWLVYKPSYVSRGHEEKQDLVQVVEGLAKVHNAQLMWFETRDDLLNYLNNKRDKNNLICGLEYFGHSNKRDWMFDYSNALDGGSLEQGMLHIWNFNKLQRGIFTADAFTKSWGCHSGEQYSGAWFKRTNIRMKGAIGKTDYSNGGLPFLSSAKGKWSE